MTFYRDGPGWPTDGVVGGEFHDEVTGAEGTIAFVTLEGGLKLGPYERRTSPDASLLPDHPSSTEFSLGIPATSPEDVDALLD